MKSNMSQTSHRTWFPFILIGLTLALAAGIWAWQSDDHPLASDAPEIVAPTLVEYQAEVIAIVQAYLEDGDAQGAYDALLDVWVPSDAKDVHLDLVIAFGKLVSGDESGAELLETVRSVYDWLP